MLAGLGYNLVALDCVNYQEDAIGSDAIISCPGGSCNWGCTLGCAIGCQAGCTNCSPGCRFGPLFTSGTTPGETQSI